jgi:exosortase K
MIRKYNLRLISFYALTLLIAYGLKYHYSHANSDDLMWVLKPTAFLVESVCDISFERESNTGFVNYDHQVIIAPSCAGINFMIIVFCLSAFSGLKQMRGLKYKNLWLGACLIAAYFYTLFVNTIRIIISIHSYETGLFQSLLSTEGIHRIEGVLVYFACLYVFYVLLTKVMEGIQSRELNKKARDTKKIRYIETLTAGLSPVFWYCSVSLGIPFLNRAYLAGNSEFFKHSAIVLSVCFLLFLVFCIVRISCQVLLIKLKYLKLRDILLPLRK